MLKRVMGKACFATLQDGSFGKTHGRIQLYVAKDNVGDEVYEAFKRWDLGDIPRRRGRAVQDAHRRAVGQGDHAAPADQEPAPAARQVPRHGRPGTEVPPALRRPDHRRGRPRALRGAQQGDRASIRSFMVEHGFLEVETPMLHPIPAGRQRQTLRHAPQRARPADVPAHRAGAVPEAPDRRRLRARVRDQPQLPQRRHLGAQTPSSR